MPTLTNRICGVCPEAHHMAAAKAADAVYHVDQPRPAKLLRELLYSAFYFAYHTTHFYALGGPDFIVCPDAPAAERNILGVLAKVGMEVGGQVIQARKQGHNVIEMIGGRKIHPATAVPGGMTQGITEEQRAEIEKIGRWSIEFAQFSLGIFDKIVLGNEAYKEMVLSDGYTDRTYYMGMVDPNGKVNFCQDIWVASSNYASTGTNLGGDSPKGGAGLGGAILAIGYRSRTQGNQSTAPGNWNYDATTSGTITARCDHISLDGKVVPLANPRFFDALIDPSSGTLTGLIICDNYGVYEATVSSTGPPVVGPRLMEKQYRELGRLPGPNGIGMVPIPFQLGESGNWVGPPLIATSAQRLPNGRLLIANSYSGSDKSGAMKFSGEVFEYDLDGTVPWC